MADKSWKQVERRVAALFGAKRTGAQGDTTFDFIASKEYSVKGRALGAEVKHERGFPKWLINDMKQAEGHKVTVKNAIDAILILVPHRAKKKDMLVVLSLEDYERLRREAATVPTWSNPVVRPTHIEAMPPGHFEMVEESKMYPGHPVGWIPSDEAAGG